MFKVLDKLIAARLQQEASCKRTFDQAHGEEELLSSDSSTALPYQTALRQEFVIR